MFCRATVLRCLRAAASSVPAWLPPRLVAEWDRDRNACATAAPSAPTADPSAPSAFSLAATARPGVPRSAQSPLHAHWRCAACGCSWAARVSSRCDEAADVGCPRCRVRRASVAAARPAVVAAATLLASEFVAFVQRDVGAVLPGGHDDEGAVPVPPTQQALWCCSACGHRFVASAEARLQRGAACPLCRSDPTERTAHATSAGARATPARPNTSRPLTSVVRLLRDVPAVAFECVGFQAKQEAVASHAGSGREAALGVSVDSPVALRWACSVCSEEFVASPRDRCRLGVGCPTCTGRRVTSSTALLTARPDVARAALSASGGMRSESLLARLSVHSSRHLAFRCETCQADTRMSVRERVFAYAGCPHCLSKQHSYLQRNPSEAFTVPTTRPAIPARRERSKLVKAYRARS